MNIITFRDVSLSLNSHTVLAGVLLVFALIVGPAVAAQQMTTAVATGILLSAVLAFVEACGGITIASYTDCPSSICIVTLSGAVYLLSTVPRPSGTPALSPTGLS
jgi:zinc/manganese transport system permease protein